MAGHVMMQVQLRAAARTRQQLALTRTDGTRLSIALVYEPTHYHPLAVYTLKMLVAFVPVS